LLCLLNLKNPAKWIVIVSLIFVLVSLGFSIYNWPETWMGFDQTNPPNLNVEKARESCGLLIGSLLVGISLIKIKPKI